MFVLKGVEGQNSFQDLKTLKYCVTTFEYPETPKLNRVDIKIV